MATLHGLYWLTANVAARRPLMLAIDDLHWCDLASLRWLAYLLPRIEGLDLLVVVCLRAAEPGRIPALVGQIVSDPLAAIVRPAPLSAEARGSAPARDPLARMPTTRSAPPAARRRAGTRCCCASSCTRSRTRASRPSRRACPRSSGWRPGPARARSRCGSPGFRRRRRRWRGPWRSSATRPIRAWPPRWPAWTTRLPRTLRARWPGSMSCGRSRRSGSSTR